MVASATDTDTGPDTERITARAQELFAAEMSTLAGNTGASLALFERARATMPLGVASSFQAADPYPIYLSHGRGAEVWDVDGTAYYDFHNGFGAMAVGHAHPKVVEAIDRAARTGTHFAVTTETTVALAEELARRFRLERVRFTNSGTEATMDAIRVARGVTGRDTICKIEGSYHGHHDAVMFSVTPGLDLVASTAEGARTDHLPGLEGHTGGNGQVDPGRSLQRPAGGGDAVRPAGPGSGLLHHRAGDDEHRHRAAEARLPGRAP